MKREEEFVDRVPPDVYTFILIIKQTPKGGFMGGKGDTGAQCAQPWKKSNF